MLSVDVEELFAYHLVVENGRLTLSPEKTYELCYERGYKQGLELGAEKSYRRLWKKCHRSGLLNLVMCRLRKLRLFKGRVRL